MDDPSDQNQSKDSEHPEELMKSKNGFENEISNSNTSNSNNDPHVITLNSKNSKDQSQIETEAPNHSESRILSLYKSVRFNELRPIDKVKNFLSNPFSFKTTRYSSKLSTESAKNEGYPSDPYLSDSGSSEGDLEETQYLMDVSDEELTEPFKLRDLMIYRTIQFMDYRRISRRFNGIRKPVSNSKALIICLFCAVLAVVPFVFFQVHDLYYVVSIKLTRGALPYISSFAYIIGAYLLAKIQLSLPLRLPVILSYLFMFATLITLIIIRNLSEIDRIIWPLLISYASVQVFLIVMTKGFIHFVPILALNGMFFPCTDHFHLLKRTQQNNNLNITISRYNDYTSIWETHSCGFFTCIYRSFYRLFLSIKIKINKDDYGSRGDLNIYRYVDINKLINRIDKKYVDYPLFGHQMRYYGRIDSNNLPHGYGEWLEDHIYGERLQGYWWHGYPVGPFTSQEIGSGSIFVNNRVAFVTDTNLEKGKMRYGVSSTESSISGYFFKQMPKTYFFNPEYRKLKKSSPTKKCEYFYIFQKSFDNIRGSNPEWCIGMLKRQFQLNKTNDEERINIFVDKLTESLKIEGFRIKNTEESTNNPNEITIKLVKYAGKKPRISKDEKEKANPIEMPLYKSITKKIFNKNDKRQSSKGMDGTSKMFESKISMLIKDQDMWQSKKHMSVHKIVANGWARVRPSTKKNLIPETALIYIHGYNLTLNEACSQMAHIVSFAKLPPYILPFLFNWQGSHWGIFSSLSYPKAVKITTNSNIMQSFEELLKDLMNLGIKSVHLLAHSCGARVLFNVIINAIKNGFVIPVLSKEFLVVNPEPKDQRIRIETFIIINPDYPMERFRNESYFIIRGYCDHIVMYVNNRDQCLWVSEFYNRERSLGKSIFEMCTSPAILLKMIRHKSNDEPFTIYEGFPFSANMENKVKLRDSDDLKKSKADTIVQMDEVKEEGKNEEEVQQRESNEDTLKMKIDDKEVEVIKGEEITSTISKIFKPRYSFKKYKGTRSKFWKSRSTVLEDQEERSLWLDMDVIDTSMIDTNVDFLKHSFFQVKREIMDDIREVILMHTRAEHRQSRLDRRSGNVYVFRVAPGDVSKLL